MKPSDRSTPHQIDRTRQIWGDRYGRALSVSEADQISARMADFFTILAEWAGERQNAVNDNLPHCGSEGASDER